MPGRGGNGAGRQQRELRSVCAAGEPHPGLALPGNELHKRSEPVFRSPDGTSALLVHWLWIQIGSCLTSISGKQPFGAGWLLKLPRALNSLSVDRSMNFKDNLFSWSIIACWTWSKLHFRQFPFLSHPSGDFSSKWKWVAAEGDEWPSCFLMPNGPLSANLNKAGMQAAHSFLG